MNYPIPKKLNCPITKDNLKKPKQSKYKNEKVLIDGIWFPSKKEGNRYLELKVLEIKGLIKDLRLQVKFELQPSFKIRNKTIRAINYIADFTYIDAISSCLIVEDTKGMRTKEYRLKAKLFAYKYGFEIIEI